MRKILELVQCKGEEACEYFLYIIYKVCDAYIDLQPWLKGINYNPSNDIAVMKVVNTDPSKYQVTNVALSHSYVLFLHCKINNTVQTGDSIMIKHKRDVMERLLFISKQGWGELHHFVQHIVESRLIVFTIILSSLINVVELKSTIFHPKHSIRYRGKK